MNLVVADITGVRIVRAIVAGELAPSTLIAYKDNRCKSSQKTMEEGLIFE